MPGEERSRTEGQPGGQGSAMQSSQAMVLPDAFGLSAGEAGFEAPYAASWLDRLIDWIDRLPGPTWPLYAAVGLLSAVIFVTIQSDQGAYANGVRPFHIFISLQPLISVAFIDYLDRVAASALARFRPVLKTGQERLIRARFCLTTMPERPALFAGLAGMLFYFLVFFPQGASGMANLGLSTTRVSMLVTLLWFTLLWLGNGLVIYHTFHQLRVIRSIFDMDVEVDPFYPDPLYSLSSISAQTAIFLLLNSYGWVWGLNLTGLSSSAVPRSEVLIPAVIVNILFSLLAGFVFIWPLWGVHRALEEEKKRTMAANIFRMKAATAQLHAIVDAGEVAGVDEWHKALTSLEMERTRIDRLPTWPWRPGLLRGFLAALLLPVIIWFIQYGLERLLG